MQSNRHKWVLEIILYSSVKSVVGANLFALSTNYKQKRANKFAPTVTEYPIDRLHKIFQLRILGL